MYFQCTISMCKTYKLWMNKFYTISIIKSRNVKFVKSNDQHLVHIPPHALLPSQTSMARFYNESTVVIHHKFYTNGQLDYCILGAGIGSARNKHHEWSIDKDVWIHPSIDSSIHEG